MYEPTWHRPTTAVEAVRILAEGRGDARLIAGGTDLAVRIAGRVELPPVLVDLGLVEELSGVSAANGRVTLGATTTHRTLERDATLRERAPVLTEACRTVGSPQIRARGTIGGNAANGSPAADSSTALLALDAVARIASADGAAREVPLREFFRGPGLTALRPAELLEAFEFDAPSEDSVSAYVKAGQRNALAIAIVSVAAVFDPAEGRVRLALGSVAPTPVRAVEAERLFAEDWRGVSDRAALLDEVAERAVAATKCIDDVRATAEHRRRLTRALVRRTLTRLCAQ
ncbi:MAG: xanthine dehydrogenase family protein subunit M [Candidatus Eisenbacteria bacterium]